VAADAGPAARSRGRAFGLPFAVLAVVGVLLGPIWAGLTPLLARFADGSEKILDGEIAMAGLGLLAGLVVAVIGLVRPGPRPTARFGGLLLGSGAGSLLAWRTGLLVGAPKLAATGVLVFWPLALSVVTVLVTLVIVLVAPDHDGPGPHAPALPAAQQRAGSTAGRATGPAVDGPAVYEHTLDVHTLDAGATPESDS